MNALMVSNCLSFQAINRELCVVVQLDLLVFSHHTAAYGTTLWNAAPNNLFYQFLATILVLPIRKAISLPLCACSIVSNFATIDLTLIRLIRC